jgi:porin
MRPTQKPVPHAKYKKTAHKPGKKILVPAAIATTPGLPPGLTPADAATLNALTTGPARLDKIVGPKFWDIPFPSYGDTLLQDYGGWRSKLAESGIGLMVFTVGIFENNLLNTPNKVPAYSNGVYTGNCVHTSGATTSICNGGQNYLGQRPTYVSQTSLIATYDLSRYGISDGQLIFSGALAKSTDDAFLRDGWFDLSGAVYRQSFLNKTFDLKIGLIAFQQEYVGSAIGGNFASTFGPAAAIQSLYGLSQENATPGFILQYNATDNLYNQAGVTRSFPIHGPTGSTFYDESIENQTGLRAFGVPHTGVIGIDEMGYKKQATPTEHFTWVRAGVLYNSAHFQDYSRLTTNPAATVNGSGMGYFLADQQFWQQAPSSPFTAYRGLYGGVTVEYAPDNATAFTQYYEGRIYWIGPTESRSMDLISFVYDHNTFNHYIADSIDQPIAAGFPPASTVLGYSAHHASNTYTVSYLAHLMPGIYASLGISYTDHPSVTYFQNEGSSLNFLASYTLVF